MFCAKCGTQFPDDSIFCVKCGSYSYEVDIDNNSNENTTDNDYFDGYDSTYGCGYSSANSNENDKQKIPAKAVEKKDNKIYGLECGQKNENAPQKPSAQTVEKKDNRIYCRKCGTQLSADSNFCEKCGYKNENAPQTSPVKIVEKDHSQKDESNNIYNGMIKGIRKLVIRVLVLLVIILPFHYVIGYGDFGFKVFPKNNLSFANTIITANTVEKLIKRYNSAGLIEKISIRQEPLFQKLSQEGIIYYEK